MTLFFLCLLGYLSGSIPAGKLIAGKKGIDIQKRGSGNIGFANVYREVGSAPGFLVLLVDVMKGFLPSMLTVILVSKSGAMLVASLAVIGHVFPVWLEFKGGKGVATALGASLAIYPALTLIAMALYVIIAWSTRISALGSLTAATSLPLVSIWLAPSATAWYAALCLFIFWTHRKGLKKLRVHVRI